MVTKIQTGKVKREAEIEAEEGKVRTHHTTTQGREEESRRGEESKLRRVCVIVAKCG
jgi:hypothetical protein